MALTIAGMLFTQALSMFGEKIRADRAANASRNEAARSSYADLIRCFIEHKLLVGRFLLLREDVAASKVVGYEKPSREIVEANARDSQELLEAMRRSMSEYEKACELAVANDFHAERSELVGSALREYRKIMCDVVLGRSEPTVLGKASDEMLKVLKTSMRQINHL